MLAGLIRTTEEPTETLLAIATIRRDGGTQPRDGINQLHVADMRIALQQDKPLPAVEVIYDGESYWLWDGFHRIEAHIAEERTTIAANVRQGTLQDAQWESYSVNAGHGLKRSNADKERQVRNALRHPKAQGMSNVQIAKHVGVDDKTVRRYRSEMEAASEIPSLTSRQGADGKTYPALAPRLPRAPTLPASPTARPLNLDETIAVIWRLIKYTAAGDQRPQTLKNILANYDKLKNYKHLLTGDVTLVEDVFLDAWRKVNAEIDGRIEHAQRTIQKAPPADVAPPADPSTLPADLIARGWELRQMAATGRWWCHNANGPRATSPYDTIAQVAEVARGMQVDAAKPTTRPAGDDEIHRALRQIEQAVTDLVNRLGVDTLRVRLDKQPTGDNWTLAVITKGDVTSLTDSTLLSAATMLRNVERKAHRANQT